MFKVFMKRKNSTQNDHNTFTCRELLDIYSACKDSGEVVEAQNKWIENLEKQHKKDNDSERFVVNIFTYFSAANSRSPICNTNSLHWMI